MSEPINVDIYERIQNDEEFLDDQWNKFDTTTKIEILEKSGVDLFNEWVKIHGDENKSPGNN